MLAAGAHSRLQSIMAVAIACGTWPLLTSIAHRHSGAESIALPGAIVFIRFERHRDDHDPAFSNALKPLTTSAGREDKNANRTD